MENAQPEPTPTPLENLTSTSDLLVTYGDGTAETVRCRIRKVSEIQEGLTRLTDEAKMTSWLFDKPDGWAETLSMQSYNDAVALAERVNADFFVALTRRGEKSAALLRSLNPEEFRKLFSTGAPSGASSTSFRRPRS